MLCIIKSFMGEPENTRFINHPSAWIPIVMSLLALAVCIGHIVVAGTTPQPDEGAATHLWQLLMAGQMPVVAYHAVKWLRRSPVPGLKIAAVQMAAIVAAVAPVWYFHW